MLGQQTGDAAAHRTAAEAGAAVKGLSVGAVDAMHQLVKGDSIVLFLEAEGATNDVEQDLEFRFVEIGHHVIEDNVGHLRVSRLGEARKAPVVEARLTGHSPPRGPLKGAGSPRARRWRSTHTPPVRMSVVARAN
jgi:hypothetical protein